MKIAISLIVLCVFLSPLEIVSDVVKRNKKTFLNTKNKVNEIFLKRHKRYLVFEKGSAVTFQGNIAKAIISGYPRGLNEIAEYTLSYELPVGYQIYHTKKPATPITTKIPTTGTTSIVPHHPYTISDHKNGLNIKSYYAGVNNNSIQRKYFKEKFSKLKCYKGNFYEYNRQLSKVCLRRTKRDIELDELTTSQRIFYDLLEKWSLIHSFLPRYCFMRTLCESSHLLLPNGISLLHDIIRILLRYTTPWAFHHKIFGRSLRQHHHIDECAKLYGPHCRVSWIHFITTVVHGSRAADFMR